MSAGTSPPTSFQTVRLSRGRHRDPRHGVCAMELSSMLGGEPFSDRPGSVSPVIAAFVRAYNDAVDARRRQDLYAVASNVVGTRADADVEAARMERCIQAGEDCLAALPRWRRRLRGLHGHGPDALIAARVAKILHRDGDRGHARALALVDELIALGAPAPRPAPRPRPVLALR